MAEVGKLKQDVGTHPEIRPGAVLTSQAGRDQGSFYLCLDRFAPHFALLADGRHRVVSRPKRKNIRHLDSTGYWDEVAGRRLQAGETLDDREIRGALGRFQEWLERRGEDGQGGNH